MQDFVGEKEGKKGGGYRERRKQARTEPCHWCRKTAPFVWQCRCGLRICQACMDENFWGLSCNGITWVCPDCGEQNGFGNL